jgi:hypothetical protein
MALKDGSTYYTKLTHVENGSAMVRRIHRIEVQARDGRLYFVEGRDLPDFIQTSAGTGFKGCHVAQILVPSRKLPSTAPHVAQPIFRPTPRDLVYLVVGCVLPIVASGLIALLSAAF